MNRTARASGVVVGGVLTVGVALLMSAGAAQASAGGESSAGSGSPQVAAGPIVPGASEVAEDRLLGVPVAGLVQATVDGVSKVVGR